MEEFFNNIKESFKNVTLEFETINIQIDSTEWIETHIKLRDEFNLKFFSWLSAIDWDNEVLLVMLQKIAFHQVLK
jgi:hypothetical protein